VKSGETTPTAGNNTALWPSQSEMIIPLPIETIIETMDIFQLVVWLRL
jgi:hypothetical protein